MASTRLRRTFHYPSESDDEETLEQGMDEQDQETLISTLSTHDSSSTRIYTSLLLVFPLAPAILHVPLLFSTRFVSSVLAIASLLASAYTLWFLPLPPVKVGVLHVADLKNGSGAKKAKRGGYGLNVPSQDSGSGTFERPQVPFVRDEVAEALAKYTVPVNAGVCTLLAVVELWRGSSWNEGVMIGGGYLPGLIMSVILWARRELRVMDLGELEKLKYGSKAI